MNSGNPALVEIIREEIRQSGPLSFARFMEHALYHPEHGYYSSDRATVGRRGDYFTNVSVGPAFGQLFALQFTEIWESIGRAPDFTLVEQGAHHGEFARDVLQAIRDEAPGFFAVLSYRIIEPFARLQDRQRETLFEFRDQVDWRESVDAAEPFAGIHFSNELFDALPVHLIVAPPDRPGDCSWMERFVAIDDDKLVFTTQPIGHDALRREVERLPALAPGYETEVNLAGPQLMRDLARKLIRGYVIAVDYGFSRAQFYDESRTAGTVQSRAQHRLLESPFTGIGESDITAHVEWTSLVEAAEASGLHLSGFTDQHHFLTGILSAFPGFAADASAKTRRALQTLLHPEMLGRRFQVLALQKNIEGPVSMSGFKFARDSRAAL